MVSTGLPLGSLRASFRYACPTPSRLRQEAGSPNRSRSHCRRQASPGNPAATILGCANFGRDADTIATIGGTIAGALRGADRIPAAWIETVGAACPVDQEALAADLLAVLLRRAERAAAWGKAVLAQNEHKDS